MVVVIACAIALVGVKIFGISPYAVLSGSMKPTYHVGSLIYVTKVDTDDLKVGDPITYVIDGGTVVTHRIVEVIPDYGENGERGFKTKGDANKTEDGTPVHENNVIGKPIFSIPLLGFVAFFIQNPPGNFLAIGFCVVIAILTIASGFETGAAAAATTAAAVAEAAENAEAADADRNEEKNDPPPEDTQNTVE